MKKIVMLHSLFRSSSTFLFKVFRDSELYWCYQEPFHEGLADKSDSAQWREFGAIEARTATLRHPQLDKPYFWEYHACVENVISNFDPSFSFGLYFLNPNESNSGLHRYVDGLIRAAPKAPLFKFCRSIGRIGWLKTNFDALHLALLRNPRDQWCSYHINTYFPDTVDFIIEHERAPVAVREIANNVQLYESLLHEPLGEASTIDYLGMDWGEFVRSYFRFFIMWHWSRLECENNADLCLDIDLLSEDPRYRNEIIVGLSSLGVEGINLDECHSERRNFSEKEVHTFQAIERIIEEEFRRYE